MRRVLILTLGSICIIGLVVQTAQAGLQIPDSNTKLVDRLRDAGATCFDEKENIRIVLTDRGQFSSGKAKLTEEDQRLISSISNIITTAPGSRKILVRGYTDSDPIHYSRHLWKSNWDLSLKRASRVAHLLIENGVPEDRLIVTGHADNDPIASNDTEWGKAQNRRVEVWVTKTNNWFHNAGIRLHRGLVNTAFGSIEVPKSMEDTGREKGAAAGWTEGLLRGIGGTLVRTASGVIDVLTFWWPGFEGEYKPLAEPDFVEIFPAGDNDPARRNRDEREVTRITVE